MQWQIHTLPEQKSECVLVASPHAVSVLAYKIPVIGTSFVNECQHFRMVDCDISYELLSKESILYCYHFELLICKLARLQKFTNH